MRSDGQCMLPLYVLVALTWLTRGRLEEAEQYAAGVFAGCLGLHVEEVPGIADDTEVALAYMAAKLTGIFGRGVFVTFAVDEQHRDVDVARPAQCPFQVMLQHLVDVKVHLRVLVAVQAADVAVVEALEQ